MNGKQVYKTIAPKGVIQRVDKSKGLGHEVESKKSESEKKKGRDKEHESQSEPSNKVSNEVTMKDLKHVPFPHRLTKASKASKVNLNARIYDICKQVRINIPMLDAIKQIPSYDKFLKNLCTVKRKLDVKETTMMNERKSVILQCKSVPKYKDPGCPTILCIIRGYRID